MFSLFCHIGLILYSNADIGIGETPFAAAERI